MSSSLQMEWAICSPQECLVADAKKCKAEVVSSEKKHEKMYSLHVAVAPTKNIERFEWFLEKATEIGIHEISPIICEHSERRILKKERLERVIQAAMKQSLRTYLPKLNDPISYSEFIEKKQKGLLFIAHCAQDEKLELKRRVAADKDITILIGPEGDFSPTEIDKAYEQGFLPVSLGEGRLRTETAALVACTTVVMNQYAIKVRYSIGLFQNTRSGRRGDIIVLILG